MIITDYNKMSVRELEIISKALDKEYTIEDGVITKVGNKNGKKN